MTYSVIIPKHQSAVVQQKNCMEVQHANEKKKKHNKPLIQTGQFCCAIMNTKVTIIT
jgi:hypothetical protein